MSPQEGAVPLHVSGPPTALHLSSVPGRGEPIRLVPPRGPVVLPRGSISTGESLPALEEKGLKSTSLPRPQIIYLTWPGQRGDPPFPCSYGISQWGVCTCVGSHRAITTNSAIDVRFGASVFEVKLTRQNRLRKTGTMKSTKVAVWKPFYLHNVGETGVEL